MEKKELLPIGSVVLLKDAVKRLMIMGYAQQEKGKEEKIWDYCGTLFPEGYLAANTLFLFDHDQIQKIYCKGLVDDEEIQFVDKVCNLLENGPDSNAKSNEGNKKADKTKNNTKTGKNAKITSDVSFNLE